MKTFGEAEAALKAFAPKKLLRENYTLDRMQALLHFIGNPQEQLKVVHIAGTSGKTSTAYFIRELLQKAGQRTGLTVSPHIESLNERAQLDGHPLAEARFVRELDRFMELVSQSKLTPSYYELMMAFAYWLFAKAQVNYAVIETGLGGLLDGSNVVRRPDKLCIITDLGLEHTEILGHTLVEIAAQKVGIVQPGNHLISHKQSPEIMRVFQQRLSSVGATGEYISVSENDPQRPSFQNRNLSLAEAAYRYLAVRDMLPQLTPRDMHEAGSHTPPGRFEHYQIGDTTIILDGAHNPQKLAALAAELARQGHQPLPTLLGFVAVAEDILDDRLKAITPIVKECFITEFSDQQDMYKQSLSATTLAQAAEKAGMSVRGRFDDPQEALRRILALKAPTVLVTGSLYLIRQLRPLLAVDFQ